MRSCPTNNLWWPNPQLWPRRSGLAALALDPAVEDDLSMVKIFEPELHIEQVEGHPGQRRLIVTYRLEIAPGDPAVGGVVHDEAVVTAHDEHDAPVFPSHVQFRFGGEVSVAAAGTIRRHLECEVHRFDLDVEQDWWDTDQAGGTKPIAEFADHLIATLTVSVGGRQAATATSPVVTGSWGALGAD